jgi:hypothetical protein
MNDIILDWQDMLVGIAASATFEMLFGVLLFALYKYASTRARKREMLDSPKELTPIFFPEETCSEVANPPIRRQFNVTMVNTPS